MKKIEIYSKRWCPYCSKAKSLLKSKGFEYEEIDISDGGKVEEEMVERSGRRTVPQTFIDGLSVGGYDDLAGLNAKGELDKLLGLEPKSVTDKIYDVTVIGAGPAGMSAAIYASRKNLSTLLLAYDLGGQMGTTYDIANYPGFQMITGPDLVQQLSDHVDQYDIEKRIGEKVVGITQKDRCKFIQLSSGQEIHTKTVIIASGASKRKLNIPGEKQLQGKGVVYCSTCDGPLFKDMTIAIVGGGNSGLEAAIEMDAIAKKVYFISAGDWSGDQILQDKIAATKNVESLKFHKPLEIRGEDKVSALTVEDVKTGKTKSLDVEGVFIEIGLFPASDFVLDLLDTNERGEIIVDRHGKTGVRGIFAAGDITDNKEKQVIVSAGEGAQAALTAFEYLVRQV